MASMHQQTSTDVCKIDGWLCIEITEDITWLWWLLGPAFVFVHSPENWASILPIFARHFGRFTRKLNHHHTEMSFSDSVSEQWQHDDHKEISLRLFQTGCMFAVCSCGTCLLWLTSSLLSYQTFACLLSSCCHSSFFRSCTLLRSCVHRQGWPIEKWRDISLQHMMMLEEKQTQLDPFLS